MSQIYDGLVDCAEGDEYCGLASEATREKLRLWIGNLTSFHHAQKTRNVVKRKKACKLRVAKSKHSFRMFDGCDRSARSVKSADVEQFCSLSF